MRWRNIWIYLNDPKRIEFQDYRSEELKGVVSEVASTYTETLNQLEGLSAMMERRYREMGEIGMRSIEEDPRKIPLVLCIVDEVASMCSEASSINHFCHASNASLSLSVIVFLVSCKFFNPSHCP